jgi:hypothetical protein
MCRRALGNWLSINGQVYGGELFLEWTFSADVFDPKPSKAWRCL